MIKYKIRPKILGLSVQLLGLIVLSTSASASALSFEEWLKSTPENVYRLQCSLKCAAELLSGSPNEHQNRDAVSRCENSLQTSCHECASLCRKLIPRLLPRQAGNSVSANHDPLADCACSTLAVTNATAAAGSSKLLTKHTDESRRNASKQLCERVCRWGSEIVNQGRHHAGSCPVAHQGPSLVVASKLSVRSPAHEDYEGPNRSGEMIEPYMNDQADRSAESGRNDYVWRSGSNSKGNNKHHLQSGCGYKICHTDADCDWTEKCCTSTSCMTRVCLPVQQDEETVDSFKITSFSLDSDKRAAKFNWLPPLSHVGKHAQNALFLLELKYLIIPPAGTTGEEEEKTLGEQSREDKMSEWMIVSNTSQMTSLHLDSTSIWPSTWYRFRIVRLSANGNLAVSQPVGPVKIAKELRDFSEPRNISASADQWFLNVDDPESVDGTLTWLPPLIADVPVTRYKIFYTQYVPSNVLAILSSPPEFKKSVPGHVTSVTLEQLIPETTYRVDIQAVSRLPSIKMRSQKATIYIRTVALDEAGDPPGLSSRRSTVSLVQPGANVKNYDVSSEQGDVYNYASNADNFRLPPPVDGLTVGEVLNGGGGRLEVFVSWTAPIRPTKVPVAQNTASFGQGDNADVFSDDEDDNQQSSESKLNQSPLRYIVEWAPLSCIQQETSFESVSPLGMSLAIRRLSLVTLNTSVTLHTLLPTCFYEVSVTSLDPSNGFRGPKQTQTFRTPLCTSPTQSGGPCLGDQSTTTFPTSTKPVKTTTRPVRIEFQSPSVSPTTLKPGEHYPTMQPKELSPLSGQPSPAPVHNLQFKPVADNGSILVQWETLPTSPLLTPIELIFSWSVYPSLEPAAGQVRRLSPNRSRVIMQNLKPGLLYVVSVVSVARRNYDAELLKSPPARIVVLLATSSAGTPSPSEDQYASPVASSKLSKERSASAGSVDQLSLSRRSSSSSLASSSFFQFSSAIAALTILRHIILDFR